MAKRAAQRFALGVDIGGTFTDIVLIGGGRVHVGKVLTDTVDLARGVLNAVRTVLARDGLEAANAKRVVHGTTLATNALIERRGARTALVVTRGFRDVLELAHGNRYDIFDLNIELPTPLVRRADVFEISERIGAHGEVVLAPKPRELQRLAHELHAGEFETVAVCLLHSYINASHERRVAAAIRRASPQIAVSLSADVMAAVGEYERASTTVANAYIQPIVRGYLARLRDGLGELGIAGEPLIMTSDGGTVACDTAVAHPVRLVESGPAGGAVAAAYCGVRAGFDDVIAFDMGGTTAKVCLIDDGRAERATEFEVARVYRFSRGSGLPLRVPVTKMIEIGAGGGSIARVDETGLLKVGPHSAGSEPGPACYARGGTVPTVTDADLVLGYLDPGFFLGGEMQLDVQRAAHAIETQVAVPLGVELIRAATGIHDVVTHNMARAAKVHCLEQGKDPRTYTLVAFGGAGPVHAYRLAEALGIRRVLFPARAGVMAAFGFLIAAPAFELVQAYLAPLEAADLELISSLLQRMEDEGRASLRAAAVTARGVTVSREVGIRYRGQKFELEVPVSKGTLRVAERARLRTRFEDAFEARYHRRNPDTPIEIATLRVVVTGPRPDVHIEANQPGNPRRARKGRRAIYVHEERAMLPCTVYDRYRLGGRVRGPAVIEETESTVIIGPGSIAEIDSDGNLVVMRPAATPIRRRPTQTRVSA